MDELKDKLIDSVIDQIHEDFGTGELMPLVELLHAVPVKSLIAFLSDANDDLNPELMAKFRTLIKE